MVENTTNQRTKGHHTMTTDTDYTTRCSCCENTTMLTDEQFWLVMTESTWLYLIPGTGWYHQQGDYICPDCAKRFSFEDHTMTLDNRAEVCDNRGTI